MTSTPRPDLEPDGPRPSTEEYAAKARQHAHMSESAAAHSGEYAAWYATRSIMYSNLALYEQARELALAEAKRQNLSGAVMVYHQPAQTYPQSEELDAEAQSWRDKGQW